MADDTASGSVDPSKEGVAPEEDFNEADMDAELTEDEATQDGPIYDTDAEEVVSGCGGHRSPSPCAVQLPHGPICLDSVTNPDRARRLV